MKISHLAVLAMLGLLLLNIPAAWYTEKLTVQALDQQYRPVQGAQAYVEYQLNDASGTVKTKPKATNESGLVDILFTDYEQVESSTDYSHILYVTYGTQNKTANLIADNGTSSKFYQMVVEAYYAVVKVHNQRGTPLDVNITVAGQTKASDSGGRAVFQLPPGSYNVRVEKGEYVKNANLVLSGTTGDQPVDVLVGEYSLDVSVKDENNTPVSSARVSVGGQEEDTNASGTAHFENISNPDQEVSVRYGQYTKNFNMMLDKDGKLSVGFDLSAPIIKKLDVVVSKGGAGTVSLFVDDAGVAASGIDSVIVKYTVNGVENNLPTYSTGFDTFEAKIPVQPPNTLVDYLVMISDKQGNIVSQGGNYLVPAAAEQQPQNQTPAGQTTPSSSNVSLEMLMGGAVALIIVIAAAVYLFKSRKADHEHEHSPPVPPPGMPPQQPEAPQAPPEVPPSP